MRVVRFFAFLDLCGFTDFADVHGDDEAMAVVTALRSVVRIVAPNFGVRIDKWLGDGVMLVGVEGVTLLEAAVESVEQMQVSACPLMVRGGVAGGEVLLVEGDDYLGRPVNLAARLCGQARPGEVLAEAGFSDWLPKDVPARSIGSVPIRGFAEAISLISIGVG
ncbi:MAG TPA: adenylate/guanylate cyclase domain-containing protein [Acidimicrobiales bacterium]